MRVWCGSKSAALDGLNNASTPIVRSELWRMGHARILYGAAPPPTSLAPRFTTRVRCCSCIHAVRCRCARLSDSAAMGRPPRVTESCMFFSGTQSATTAQCMCSRPAFKMSSSSSASPPAVDRCEDISSSMDRSRSRPPKSCSREPSCERSDSSRRKHSNAGCTRLRTCGTSHVSVCPAATRPRRLTTPSKPTSASRTAKLHATRSASSARRMPSNCAVFSSAFDMAALTVSEASPRSQSSEAQTRLPKPSCTTTASRPGIRIRSNRLYARTMHPGDAL